MSLPWDDDRWLPSVTSWIGAQLKDTSNSVEIMHRYSWSAMAKVDTSSGHFYFKATAPPMKYEAALTLALAQWRPDVTVDLVGIDIDHGWLLMRDSGPTLRSEHPRGLARDWLITLFRTYAQLQIDTITQVTDFLAGGVPDRSLDAVVAGGKRFALDSSLLDSLADSVGQVELPSTLVHEEVHDANVLIRQGLPVFIDWSDSCVGHPFFGVVVALRSISDKWGLQPGDPFLESLVDAYLEPWTYLRPRDELRSVFAPAYRLGMLNRALSWQAGIADLDNAAASESTEYVAAWLREFSDASDPKPGT